MINIEHLKFRRQFISSSSRLSFPKGWKESIYLNGNLFVYTHPDLKTISIHDTEKNVEIILIGYIIDPYHKNKSNEEIIKELLIYSKTFDCFIDCLNKYSGRFVLFLCYDLNIYLFHDPCGLRRIYYAFRSGILYFSSSQKLLSKYTPLNKIKDFDIYFSSKYKNSHIEYYLPAGLSQYNDVFQLVPNHYLDVNNKKQVRFWPKKAKVPKSLEYGIATGSTLLRDLVISASKRFELALPVTAGIDSRMLIAASKPVLDNIFLYTLIYRSLDAYSPDIVVPLKVLMENGLSYHLLNCRKKMDDEFFNVYMSNSCLSHKDWAQIAYGIYTEYPENRVCLKGNCSEITRCEKYPSGYHDHISSVDQIMSLYGDWKGMDFIKDYLSRWFKETMPIIEEFQYDILDIFYWEIRMGGWQAQSQLEWDIAQEVYTPYNHRPYLETLLAVSTEYRNRTKGWVIHQEIIKRLWPEMAEYPINRIATAGIAQNLYRKFFK